MGKASTNQECANAAEIISLVRSGDYDRFLAIQLAPTSTRAGLYALTAFHVEIARIAETVSEPMIGHIRLAWWREGVDELVASKPARNHPVMLALAPLLAAQPMLVPFLHTMLDARAVDFDDMLVTEEAAWLAYCDNTAGALHRAWAMLLDSDAAIAQDAVIGGQARAYAMVELVRAIPFMAQRGWVRFPEARLKAHGLTSLEASPALAAMVESIVTEALSATMHARLEKSLRSLIGVAALNANYARELQKFGYNPYRLTRGTLSKVWQIIKLNYL